MPIDPAQLRARTVEIAARLDHPSECEAAIHRLLDDYADRTRRVSPRLADSMPSNWLKVPAPVMQAVITALRRPAQASPMNAHGVARRLWGRGTREERRLAAEILGFAAPRIPADAINLIEMWLPEIESDETADAVARFALSPLLIGDPLGFLQRASRWIGQHKRWVRRFGVSVISALAHDRRWDDVPAALDLLRPLMAERDPTVRQAVINALNDLASRNPLMVSRFLREQAVRSNHHTHAIIRATLEALPEDDQRELVRVMRS
jgi:hypothetical protein